MKKIIALILAVMMLAFTVASCSSGEGEKKTTPPAASTEETTTTTSVVDPVKKGPIAHITFDELSDSLVFIDDTGNGHNAVASHKLKIVEGRFGNAVTSNRQVSILKFRIPTISDSPKRTVSQ